MMIEKDLRRLKRTELLEMLIAQGKEMEQLRGQMDEMQKKLDDRQICLDNAGTIAEASLQLNGVFDAAQSAAQQYLENIKRLSDRQEEVCAAMEKRTKEKCAEMERRTKEKCDKLSQEAEKDVEARWAELSIRLQNFYDEHNGLRELLSLNGGADSEKNE